MSKRGISWCLIACGLLIITFLCCFKTHSMNGVLVNTFEYNGIMYDYYATEDGNGWVAPYNPTLKIGESYTLYFHNNLTPNNIYDDVIINIQQEVYDDS